MNEFYRDSFDIRLYHICFLTGSNSCCRRLFFSSKAVTPANTPLSRQLSLSPPPLPTPPPDFSQCVMGSSHFLPLPFPNHGLANQQNSENMATEKNKMAAEVDVNFLQMSCYLPGWEKTSNKHIPHVKDSGYLRTEANCYSPGSRDASSPQIQNRGPDELLLCQKDKRRFSKASRTSSRTRADDLSI